MRFLLKFLVFSRFFERFPAKERGVFGVRVWRLGSEQYRFLLLGWCPFNTYATLSITVYSGSFIYYVYMHIYIYHYIYRFFYMYTVHIPQIVKHQRPCLGSTKAQKYRNLLDLVFLVFGALKFTRRSDKTDPFHQWNPKNPKDQPKYLGATLP